MELDIKYIPIENIKPYENNPRRHSREQIEAIKESVSKLGNRKPIELDENNIIICGHGRLEAYKMIGLKEVPVIIHSDMTEDQKKAYRIADNELALRSEWDFEALNIELKDLDFSFINDLKIKDILLEEDEFEIEEDLKTDIKTGDIYKIGKHYLLCGDSRDEEMVSKLLNGAKADIMFTDPPYGVSIGKKNKFLNSFRKSGQNQKDIENDDLKSEELKNELLIPVFKNIKENVLNEDASIFITAPQGGELGMMMMMMMKESLYPVRHVLIWKKNAPTFSMGRLDYEYKHEPILLTWGKKHNYYGKGEHRTSVWEIDKPTKNKEHPTMKPIALYANAYLNNAKEGDIVFEPFAGSGTAFLAAEQTGLTCYGVEFDPVYCQVIINRMKNSYPDIIINKIL